MAERPGPQPLLYVTTQYRGGPYDDASFAAGFDSGMLAGHFLLGPGDLFQWSTAAANVPMIDHIAMAHGYVVDAVEDRPDGFVDVTLRRSGASRGR